MSRLITRRGLLVGASAFGSLLLAGCNREQYLPPKIRGGLKGVSDVLNMATMRLMQSGNQLAPEYALSERAPSFPTWGQTNPEDEEYQRLARDNFRDWRLPVTGLVERPIIWSLEQIKRLPRRTQVTAHNCEQGWSAIAQWTGTPLLELLRPSILKPEARYVVIHTVDGWYDAIDMFDVVHPQTILAYGLNGKDLPKGNGAPLRLRLERHCGYRSLKFIKTIQVADSVERFGKGKGSISADYDWHWFAGA